MPKQRYFKTNKFLREISERFGEAVKNAGVDALKKGAEAIAETAKKNCPVDSGRLRDSIHVDVKQTKTSTKIKVVADAADDDGFCYAKLVEFSPKINKPFLIPARDQHAKKIREDTLDAIRNAIHREWNK